MSAALPQSSPAMPLFEYQCEDCGAVLELLLKDGASGPRMCGFRCPLPPGSDHEARGMGRLARQHSAFATVRAISRRQTITPEEAGRAGMTVYANEGGGKLRRVGGSGGPETLDVGES